HLAVRLEPMNALAFLAPEAVGVGNRARVQFAIFGLIRVGAPLPLRRNVINFLCDLLCDGLVHEPPPRRRERLRRGRCVAGIMRHGAASTRRTTSHFCRGSRVADRTQRTPNAPRIAPMTTSTASQWPASITVSMTLRPWKA